MQTLIGKKIGMTRVYDENGAPINYQIVFTYDDNADTITVNMQFANADDENTTISFPLVFHRDVTTA